MYILCQSDAQCSLQPRVYYSLLMTGKPLLDKACQLQDTPNLRQITFRGPVQSLSSSARLLDVAVPGPVRTSETCKVVAESGVGSSRAAAVLLLGPCAPASVAECALQ